MDAVVLKPGDVPMFEMPNGKFRASFLVTFDTCGADAKVSAGRAWIAAGNSQGSPGTHDADEVIYVISGRGYFLAGEDRLEVRGGDVLYCPAGLWHSFVTETDGLTLVWVIASGWESYRSMQEEAERDWRRVDPKMGWHTR
jgi:mannose-6-phosphate isomerase-like protein (cupin superfamily)